MRGLCVPLEPGEGDLLEVDALGPHRERPAAEAGEVEQIPDEALEPPRLPLDHRPRRRGLQDAVLERLGMPADRREGRLQLVADREEERALGVLRPVELLGEVVERRSEGRDLPRPGDRHGPGRLAARERPARGRHTCDRPGDGAGEHEGDGRGEDGADEAGEAEAERERQPVGLLALGRAEQDDRLVPALARGEQEARAAHVERAARRVGAPQASGRALGQEQVRLCGREDREPLLVRREEAPELVVDSPAGVLAALRGDQLDLTLECVDRGRLERTAGQQRAGDDRHDERDEHRPRDADEQARAEAHATTL